jgi:hypothetical protein
MYMPELSFIAPSAAPSSGPSSPHVDPYTTSIDMLDTTNMWQTIPMDAPLRSHQDSAMPQFTYGAFSWPDGPWTAGAAPISNDDFDIAAIPPIMLDVPKFDASSLSSCAPESMNTPLEVSSFAQSERDPYMHGFQFDQALTALSTTGAEF